MGLFSLSASGLPASGPAAAGSSGRPPIRGVLLALVPLLSGLACPSVVRAQAPSQPAPAVRGSASGGAARLPTPQTVPSLQCAAPQPGRYVVMGDGVAWNEPVARILLETWHPDGRLEGVRLERRGREYREVAYTGRYRSLSLCRAGIERGYDGKISTSQAVLDPSGRPRYSLGTLPDVVMVSRWFPQSGSACAASLLDGSVVSMQQGRSWRAGQWRPNAVIQSEQWSAGRVHGIAISSYGPRIEEATYSGRLLLGANCLATIEQKDSLGVPYNYRAVLLSDGSGYLYLQTDPDDLTVGFLQHLPAAAAAAQPR